MKLKLRKRKNRSHNLKSSNNNYKTNNKILRALLELMIHLNYLLNLKIINMKVIY